MQRASSIQSHRYSERHNPPAPAAILVDFGGVLVYTAKPDAHAAWERRLDLAPGGLRRALFDHWMSWRAMSGKVTAEAALAAVASHHDLSSTETAQMWRDFWDRESLNVPLIDYLNSHRSVATLAVVSNFWLNGRALMTERYGLDQLFHYIFISSEESIKKPSYRLLQRISSRLNCPIERMFLLDDSWLNIVHARLCGVPAVFFRDNEQALKALRERLEPTSNR